MFPLPSVPAAPPNAGSARADEAALRAAAIRLESAFLSEMLGAAGLGTPRGTFGGGAGEAQFASLLRDTQAAAMVRAGGLGLAESLFEALVRRGGVDG